MLTPNLTIALDSPEFNSFPVIAAKLVRKSASSARQIRVATRFCQTYQFFTNYIKPKSRFKLCSSTTIADNINMIMISFKKLKILRKDHLVFLPKLTRSDLLTFCESDLFLSRADKRTTENRVETVHAGASLTLRICIENGSNYFSTYIASTVRSSRGASKKHAICVFTVSPDSDQIQYTSSCDCIRGFSTSCAHRGRVLCELADRINGPPPRPDRKLTREKTIHALQRQYRQNFGKKSALQSSSQTASQEGNASSRKRAKPTQKAQTTPTIESLHPLLTYLPEGNTEFTHQNVALIRKKLQEIAHSSGKTDIQWPRRGKGDNSEIILAGRLLKVHQLLQTQALISPLAPDSPGPQELIADGDV